MHKEGVSFVFISLSLTPPPKTTTHPNMGHVLYIFAHLVRLCNYTSVCVTLFVRTSTWIFMYLVRASVSNGFIIGFCNFHSGCFVLFTSVLVFYFIKYFFSFFLLHFLVCFVVLFPLIFFSAVDTIFRLGLVNSWSGVERSYFSSICKCICVCVSVCRVSVNISE